MNWRPFTPSSAAARVLHLPTESAAFWLEGSLAAIPTLAPVIAMFPATVPSRAPRRRSGRQKL